VVTGRTIIIDLALRLYHSASSLLFYCHLDHGPCEVLVQCPPQQQLQHLYPFTSALGAKNSSNLGAFEIIRKNVSGSSNTKSGTVNMRLIWRPLSAKDVKPTFIAQSVVGDLFVAYSSFAYTLGNKSASAAD
jgi:hypothetical protein